jgi:GNAT superfamily N-acetyltransferase
VTRRPFVAASPAGLGSDPVARIERAALRGWPATFEQHDDDGWVMRATPGLDRGRSNNARTPCRPLDPSEIAPAIERVRAYAAARRVRPGIQVTPVAVHGEVMAALDARGWSAQPPTLVLTGPAGSALPDEDPVPAARGGGLAALVRTDHATPEWLVAWARCEPGRDVEAHAATVLARLRGRATFVRAGADAVAITVPDGDLVGMFCLAVEPGHRCAGLATALVRALLSGATARVAYLQVEEGNRPARALYGRLGFTESHRYRHRTEPGG